jgi:quercetin dioxygenase-like cupin family protein/DNA-binding XRE family transcriptional regulator
MPSSQQLGNRIHTYRERLGLSVEDLAKNAGIDAALLQNIEDNKVYPALGVLVKVSRALGQRLGTFMDDQFIEDPLIVRTDGRVEETTPHHGKGPGNYHYYPLGKGKTDRHMEPFYIVIEPTEEKDMSSHEGEEFIIVVSGEVELTYGKETYRLKAGDSMYYNSVVPHSVSAAGSIPAGIYAVVYTPF